MPFCIYWSKPTWVSWKMPSGKPLKQAEQEKSAKLGKPKKIANLRVARAERPFFIAFLSKGRHTLDVTDESKRHRMENAMNIAAYCRVSTDKADQLNSLEAQKRFFTEYTEKSGYTLVRVYADEGISGTPVRYSALGEFLRMLGRQTLGEWLIRLSDHLSCFLKDHPLLLSNAVPVERQLCKAPLFPAAYALVAVPSACIGFCLCCYLYSTE